MVHAATHMLSGILPGFSLLFSYEENSKKLVIPSFLQVFAYQYHKDLGLLTNLNLTGPKNILKAKKFLWARATKPQLN